jgi:hypothetical protein
MHGLWSSTTDFLPTEQFMHSRARGIRWVEYDEVGRTVLTTFEADNGHGMTRLLQIDGWQQSLVDLGTVRNSSLGEVPLDSIKQYLVGLDLAVLEVAERLDSAIDLEANKKRLRLENVQSARRSEQSSVHTSGVPMYFLVSRMPPV